MKMNKYTVNVHYFFSTCRFQPTIFFRGEVIAGEFRKRFEVRTFRNEGHQNDANTS